MYTNLQGDKKNSAKLAKVNILRKLRSAKIHFLKARSSSSSCIHTYIFFFKSLTRFVGDNAKIFREIEIFLDRSGWNFYNGRATFLFEAI